MNEIDKIHEEGVLALRKINEEAYYRRKEFENKMSLKETEKKIELTLDNFTVADVVLLVTIISGLAMILFK